MAPMAQWLLVAVLALATFSASPLLAAEDPRVQRWLISDARIVEPGIASIVPDGLLISDYRVEAVARELIGEGWTGTFQLTAAIFAPTVDLLGLQAGFWYLIGAFSIVDPISRLPFLEASIDACLPFNPAAVPGEILAEIYHGPSMRPPEIGNFIGTERFEGELLVRLDPVYAQMMVPLWREGYLLDEGEHR